MNRVELTLDELKEALVGWCAVYASFGEEECKPTKVVEVDLICEWRVPDGKRWFVEVPFDTDEEMAQIKAVLEESLKTLVQTVQKHFAKLTPEEFAACQE